MKVNKIVFSGEIIMDLTNDTVEADKMLEGYTAHNKAGEIIVGTLVNGGESSAVIDDGVGNITVNSFYVFDWVDNSDGEIIATLKSIHATENSGNIILI